MPWHCADVPASPKPDFGAAESVLILQTKSRRVPQPPPRRCMKSSTATNTHQHALLRRWAMKAARAGRSSRAHRFRNVGSRPRCAAALGSRARVGRPKWTDHAETWRAGRIAAKSAQVGRCAGPSMDHHLYGTGLVRPGCPPLHAGRRPPLALLSTKALLGVWRSLAGCPPRACAAQDEVSGSSAAKPGACPEIVAAWEKATAHGVRLTQARWITRSAGWPASAAHWPRQTVVRRLGGRGACNCMLQARPWRADAFSIRAKPPG